MNKRKIIMDIDGVLADFTTGILDASTEYQLRDFFPASPSEVNNWNICDRFIELFNKVKNKDEFWLNLKVLNRINFVPELYLTARPCKTSVTAKWLENNGFPKAPIITVNNPLDKINVLKSWDHEFFIDDHIETIETAIANGINGLLFSAPYQRGHVIKHTTPIIKSLGELDNICN